MQSTDQDLPAPEHVSKQGCLVASTQQKLLSTLFKQMSVPGALPPFPHSEASSGGWGKGLQKVECILANMVPHSSPYKPPVCLHSVTHGIKSQVVCKKKILLSAKERCVKLLLGTIPCLGAWAPPCSPGLEILQVPPWTWVSENSTCSLSKTLILPFAAQETGQWLPWVAGLHLASHNGKIPHWASARSQAGLLALCRGNSGTPVCCCRGKPSPGYGAGNGLGAAVPEPVAAAVAPHVWALSWTPLSETKGVLEK